MINDTQVLSQRAGASNRTADELAAVFLWDAAVLTSPEDKREEWLMMNDERFTQDMITACQDAIENGWCSDPENSEYLSELIQTGEGWLSEKNMLVHWDDGFVIYDTKGWTDDDWTEVEGW